VVGAETQGVALALGGHLLEPAVVGGDPDAGPAPEVRVHAEAGQVERHGEGLAEPVVGRHPAVDAEARQHQDVLLPEARLDGLQLRRRQPPGAEVARLVQRAGRRGEAHARHRLGVDGRRVVAGVGIGLRRRRVLVGGDDGLGRVQGRDVGGRRAGAALAAAAVAAEQVVPVVPEGDAAAGEQHDQGERQQDEEGVPAAVAGLRRRRGRLLGVSRRLLGIGRRRLLGVGRRLLGVRCGRGGRLGPLPGGAGGADGVTGGERGAAVLARRGRGRLLLSGGAGGADGVAGGERRAAVLARRGRRLLLPGGAVGADGIAGGKRRAAVLARRWRRGGGRQRLAAAAAEGLVGSRRRVAAGTMRHGVTSMRSEFQCTIERGEIKARGDIHHRGTEDTERASFVIDHFSMVICHWAEGRKWVSG